MKLSHLIGLVGNRHRPPMPLASSSCFRYPSLDALSKNTSLKLRKDRQHSSHRSPC